LKKYALVRKQAIQTSIHSHENTAPAKIAKSITMIPRRMKASAMPACIFGDSGFILLSKFDLPVIFTCQRYKHIEFIFFIEFFKFLGLDHFCLVS